MRITLGFVLLFVCSPARAEDTSVMRGVGTYSCAHFGKSYKDDPKLAELVYGSWAQGFMSGLNAQRIIDGKPMRRLPAPQDGQDIGIRRLCDKRPFGKLL